MRVNVLTEVPQILANPVEYIQRVESWDMVRSSLERGLSRPYYTEGQAVVLPDNWPDPEVQSFQRITGRSVIAVELDDHEYQNLIALIDSRSFRLPLASR